MQKLIIIEGDITKIEVDAIVNAANKTLLGGGGIDGAIHRAAGPELLEECKKLKGCETGEAKITKGYNLPVKYIIHTVGPVWKGGDGREDDILALCYKNSLKLAVDNNIKVIAFPSISTGAYGFPVNRAARIAVNEINNFLEADEDNNISKVFIVCFDSYTYESYINAKKQICNEEFR
ncbi:MAG TPA: O-acetyl-ADP-ribose deacetylase [Clostridiales bacterium]|nr:O-acetyl-ADP-ribose deacetylase [Clostridiales bacterium]